MAAPPREAAGFVVETTGGADRSFDITIPDSLTDSVLVVAVTWFGGANSTVTVAEFDAVDITGEEIGTQQSAFSSDNRDGVFMAYVLNPGNGVKTVDITFSENQGSNACVLAYWIYSAADTPNVPDAFIDPNHEGSGNSYAGSMTTTVADCALGFFVVDFNNTGNGTITGWTRITSGDPDYVDSWVLDDAGAAGAKNFTWSKSGSSFGVAGFAIPPTTQSNKDIAPTIAGAGEIQAQLQVVKNIAPTVAGAGDIATSIQVAKQIAPTIAAAGDIATSIELAREIAPTIAAIGELQTSIELAREIAPTVAAAGDILAQLQVLKEIAPTIGGISEIIALLSGQPTKDIAPTIAGAGEIQAQLQVIKNIAPTIGGISDIIARPIPQATAARKRGAGAGGSATSALIAAMELEEAARIEEQRKEEEALILALLMADDD